MVDDLFFGSGEDPFTREAMIQHKKDEWDAIHSSYGYIGRVHRGYLVAWYNRFNELEDHYYGTKHTWK